MGKKGAASAAELRLQSGNWLAAAPLTLLSSGQPNHPTTQPPSHLTTHSLQPPSGCYGIR